MKPPKLNRWQVVKKGGTEYTVTGRHPDKSGKEWLYNLKSLDGKKSVWDAKEWDLSE